MRIREMQTCGNTSLNAKEIAISSFGYSKKYFDKWTFFHILRLFN